LAEALFTLFFNKLSAHVEKKNNLLCYGSEQLKNVGGTSKRGVLASTRFAGTFSGYAVTQC